MKWRTERIVVVALVVAALMLMMALTSDGEFGIHPNSPLAGKVEGGTNGTLGGGGVLNLLLAAGIFGVILDAIITGYRERNAREREMLGLLRMLYVEIERNRGDAELLLDPPHPQAPNPYAGWWTDHIYDDDTWKEVRSRLSQLLPDEDKFNLLVAYYGNNADQEKGLLKAIERGTSLAAPGDAFVSIMAEKTREQLALAEDILAMILGYIGDPPIGRESIEGAKQELERHLRELDAEKNRREPEQ